MLQASTRLCCKWHQGSYRFLFSCLRLFNAQTGQFAYFGTRHKYEKRWKKPDVNKRLITNSAHNIGEHFSDIYIKNKELWPKGLMESFMDATFPCCSVKRDFITEEEEKIILSEVEPRFKRLRYEKSHWDDAIYLYRETEKSSWSQDANTVLDRIRHTAFPADCHHISYVHVLDLHKDGHIKPHIDSVRYCGDVISGICLLSDAVMRLVHKDSPSLIVDLLLPRKSFYLLRGPARYEFTHEILSNEVSYFCDVYVPKGRRISVLCRSQPKYDDTV